jgi:hypothetical protein
MTKFVKKPKKTGALAKLALWQNWHSGKLALWQN